MSIQVTNLTHIYSQGMPYETVALSAISFAIPTGSFVGIIGHTGSGKSTLIQHLNGLLKPKEGSIVIDGVDITDPKISLREIRQKIGLVFQYPEYQLFEETVEKDIAFGPINLGLTEEEARERVKEAMELVNLSYDDISQRSPFDLSGGQKRRVAIAGVIAMKPQILILDEPTAGLDPKAHKEILRMVREIHRKEKNTILLVSHNMGDIAALSDQVLVMDRGRLALQGTPEQVFSHKEELRRMGLELPPATVFMEAIEKRCATTFKTALTIDEAEQIILDWIGKR